MEGIKKKSCPGRIITVQIRIRLTRSYDERTRSYQGTVLRIAGICGDETAEFQIAVGKAAHAKHQFYSGMIESSRSVQVPDPRLELAGFFKISGIKVGLEDREGNGKTVARVRKRRGEGTMGNPFLKRRVVGGPSTYDFHGGSLSPQDLSVLSRG